MPLNIISHFSSSSLIDLEHQSGNHSNGRYLPRTISLNIVLSYVYWLFTTTIFPHSHSQGGGAEVLQGSSDVEMGVGGVGGALQLQAPPAASAEPNNTFVVPPPTVVVVGGSTQGAETIMGNQTVVNEAESRTGPQSYIIGTLPNHQINGQHVVGIWIVPTVMGVISCLIQVVVGSQKDNSDQKLLVYLCSGISLATAFLGIVLSILPTMQWINNRRRDLLIRSTYVVALGSTFVDICVLITFLFIVEQSRVYE